MCMIFMGTKGVIGKRRNGPKMKNNTTTKRTNQWMTFYKKVNV